MLCTSLRGKGKDWWSKVIFYGCFCDYSYYYSCEGFFFLLQRKLRVFRFCLSDSKSSQVFRTLFRILDDLSNATFWISLALPLISNSSSLFTKPLRIVPSVSITIVTTVTFILLSFSSLVRPKHLSRFWLSYNFKLISGIFSGNRGYVCISKSKGIVCVSFCGKNSGSCIYHVVVW